MHCACPLSGVKRTSALQVRAKVPLLFDGGRPPTGASFLTGWDRRHGGLSLACHDLPEPYEQHAHDEQWETAANDSDGDLDRKRICDANGVTKNVDQFFHVITPRGQHLGVRIQLSPRASRQEACLRAPSTAPHRVARLQHPRQVRKARTAWIIHIVRLLLRTVASDFIEPIDQLGVASAFLD